MSDAKRLKKEAAAAEDAAAVREEQHVADEEEDIKHLPDGDGLEDAGAAELAEEQDVEANGEIYRALETLQAKLMEVTSCDESYHFDQTIRNYVLC